MGTRKPLVIERVDMYEKENAEAHRTAFFEVVRQESPPTAVLRRGQIFDLTIHFDRELAKGVDIVKLVFSFGKEPNMVRGTRGVGTLNDNRNESLDDLKIWGVKLLGTNGKACRVQVRSPVDSPVGVWTLHVETTTLGSREPPNTYLYDNQIYILFNPWHKDDLTYMEDTELLNEYVLSDVGKIWKGYDPYAWNFGQFEACVLPACVFMLERSKLKDVFHGNPVRVSRAISKIVNSYDDNGVLLGHWGGNYPGGTHPSSWTGSPAIIEQFFETQKPVYYGQCWVFAGVVTTVCRALGLPARAVTNIGSAHDANASLTIDEFYDESNRPLKGVDKIWNFHVWNEAWMIRPDLPKGYGGWQVIDATPQERSDYYFQCGPTSVEAIKQGAVGYNYDVAFMVATVNADVMRWKEDPTNETTGYSRISCDQQLVGKQIFTKKPFIFDVNGNDDPEDITRSYKALEGSSEERQSLHRAARSTGNGLIYHLPSRDEEDVEFKLAKVDRVKIGEPFDVFVHITNNASKERNVFIKLSASSVYYNGIKANKVKDISQEFALQPNDREAVRLTITGNDYSDKLVEQSFLKLFAIATVKETNQNWADEDDFQVLKPTINIRFADDYLVVGKSSRITLSFHNPLKKPLTKCQFKYSGPGLSKEKTLPFPDAAPGEEVMVEPEVVPQKSGNLHLVATFDSIELKAITGCATIRVSRY